VCVDLIAEILWPDGMRCRWLCAKASRIFHLAEVAFGGFVSALSTDSTSAGVV